MNDPIPYPVQMARKLDPGLLLLILCYRREFIPYLFVCLFIKSLIVVAIICCELR